MARIDILYEIMHKIATRQSDTKGINDPIMFVIIAQLIALILK